MLLVWEKTFLILWKTTAFPKKKKWLLKRRAQNAKENCWGKFFTASKVLLHLII